MRLRSSEAPTGTSPRHARVILAVTFFVAALIVVEVAGRAAAPTGQYVIGTDTVQDTRTLLTWQRVASATKYDFSGAGGYCQGLTIGGATWRVPTKKELETLVDEQSTPKVDAAAFPGTPANTFWTATKWAGDTSQTWYVDFNTGGSYYDMHTLSWYVRCVH